MHCYDSLVSWNRVQELPDPGACGLEWRCTYLPNDVARSTLISSKKLVSTRGNTESARGLEYSARVRSRLVAVHSIFWKSGRFYKFPGIPGWMWVFRDFPGKSGRVGRYGCTDAHDMGDLLSVKPLKNFMKCADGQNSVKSPRENTESWRLWLWTCDLAAVQGVVQLYDSLLWPLSEMLELWRIYRYFTAP